MKKLVWIPVFLMVPALAFAGVTVKNKDKKEVSILIKRSGSTTKTGVPGGVSMDVPGAPVKITLEKGGAAIEADEGDTVVIEKGKLTKIAAESMDGGESTEPEATPAPEAETDGQRE